MTSEVLGFLKFLVHFIRGVVDVYSLKILWTNMQMWMNAIKRYCKQQGRRSCLTLLDIMMWRWQVAANTVAEAMLKLFSIMHSGFCSRYKIVLGNCVCGWSTTSRLCVRVCVCVSECVCVCAFYFGFCVETVAWNLTIWLSHSPPSYE